MLALNESQTQPQSASAAAGFRPTLFLGVGGAASRVLLHLRQRLTRRFGEPERLPSLRFLLLDTELTSLRRVEKTAADDGLLAEELLYLPLRKPVEYRASADELLSWLSRRWLYNIPRSLHTEGLRPLGRLAFVDHRQTIADRVRGAIGACAQAEAVAASSQTLAMSVREVAPMVVVVASIDGGTGGGMLLDVAYAVRQQLEEFGLPADGVRGVMLHATLANRALNDLRKANAYATLTELNHFMQGGATYRAGPMEVLPAGDVSEPPFRDAYLIDLGEHLSDAEFDTATEQVAEYLYLDAATSCGAALEGLRRSSSEPPATKDNVARLRSFGLSAIRFDRVAVARGEAQLLCLQLAQQWLGQTTGGEAAEFRIQPPDFRIEDLLNRLKAVADQALGGNADAHFRSLVIESSGKPAIVGDDDPAGPYGEELRRIHAVLGLPTQFDGAQSPRLTRFETTLRETAQKLGEGIGQTLTDSISALVDAPQGQLPAAVAAGSLFHEHVRNLRQAAEAALKDQQADATALWSRLQRGDLPSERFGWFGRSSATNDAETYLLRYCHDRLSAMLHKHLSATLQDVVRKLATLNDQLFRLRQSIEWLAAEFAALVELRQADADATSAFGSALNDELRRFGQAEFIACFEQSFKSAWLASEGGLVGFALRPAEDWQKLKETLLSHGERMVAASLGDLNAWQLLSRVHRSGDAMAGVLAETAEKATPKLRPAGLTDSLLAVIPQSGGSKELIDILHQTVRPAATVFSHAGDLVFVREAGAISLPEAAAAIIGERGQCAEAARRVLTRSDVHWASLSPSAAVTAIGR